jgi:hypothetical protein
MTHFMFRLQMVSISHLSIGVGRATCSRWFHARPIFDPLDGGNMFLRNVASQKDYMTLRYYVHAIPSPFSTTQRCA